MPTRYQDEDLNLSLLLPDGWTTAQTEQLPLVLFAPESDGFRPNMTFNIRELDPPTPDNFNDLVERTRRNHEQDYNAFSLIDARRALQDGFPAYIQRHHWEDDDNNNRLTQIFALILAGPQALHSIHGTCLRSQEDDLMPQFKSVFESLKFPIQS